jgi:hypothetical protein
MGNGQWSSKANFEPGKQGYGDGQRKISGRKARTTSAKTVRSGAYNSRTEKQLFSSWSGAGEPSVGFMRKFG